ncbi:acyl-CoA dehydrogenase family protein [Aromatoleum evansii]|uniref:acyl-CoA dehydrogenase family protein n=1 Tax=Aromatoleum evansii TaxID=59406 RepID=UPI00145DD14F|nr:acyl-CoA dehydrogenase family protein [Aromatoleum evansii]NMG31557.1 acyl-CoA dehydrogenase [Aromatoleum evansii]
MSLVYSEEQRLLADTAAEFLQARSPVAAQRRLRDEGAAPRFDDALWKEMVGMGWSAIPFPEDLGGLAFGCMGLGAVFEALGRNLAATPLLSSIVLGGTLIELAGSGAQQAEWMPLLIAGDKRIALALDEHARHDPAATALRAERRDTGYVLQGEKVFVADGQGADAFVVVARTGGMPGEREGLSLFVVPAHALGLNVSATGMIDSRNHARLRLDGVRVDAGALLGVEGQAWTALDAALDRGRVCLAAELLGMTQNLFDTTVEYLKTRVQFDVPIGSFQALQHRAAWCYAHLQLARSAVMAGLAAMDDPTLDAAGRARLASLAKWKAGDVAHRISREAVQMHGGMGVTDELDVGLFLKRIRVAQALLGDGDFHVQRYGDMTPVEA